MEPPWRCDCCQRGLPKPRRGREIPWLLPPLQPRAPQRSPWLSPSGSQLTGARNSQQGPLGLTAERGRAGRDLRTNGAGMGPGGTRIAHKSANGRHCGSQLPLTPQEEGAQAGAWESRRAHELGLLTAAGRKHPRSALDPRACPARPLRCCEPLIPAGKCPPALSNTIASAPPQAPVGRLWDVHTTQLPSPVRGSASRVRAHGAPRLWPPSMAGDRPRSWTCS